MRFRFVPAIPQFAAAMLTSLSCVRSGAAENTPPGDVARPVSSETPSDTASVSGLPVDSTAFSSGQNTLFGIPVDSYNVKTEKVRRNQFISSILAAQGISWNDIEKLLSDNKETFDPRRVREWQFLFGADNKRHTQQDWNTLFISMIRGCHMFSPSRTPWPYTGMMQR